MILFTQRSFHLDGLLKHRLLGPAQELLIQAGVEICMVPLGIAAAGPTLHFQNHVFNFSGLTGSQIQNIFFPCW